MTQDDLLPVETPTPAVVRRPRRRRRQTFLAAGLTGLVVTGAGSSADGPLPFLAPAEASAEETLDPAPLFARTMSEVTGRSSGEPVSVVVDGRAPVARWGDVRIFTDGDETEMVGFHESNSADALPLTAARPVAKSHHAGAALPTTGEGDGQVIVLPTRGRAGGPMTAIDLAVQPDAAVTAPVDGVVVEVSPIQYEGADNKITIRPHANPDVVVSILHVDDPLVEPGDRVRGGETPVAATPRQLDFESQIDRFTEAARGSALPHVHVEMRAAPQATA